MSSGSQDVGDLSNDSIRCDGLVDSFVDIDKYFLRYAFKSLEVGTVCCNNCPEEYVGIEKQH